MKKGFFYILFLMASPCLGWAATDQASGTQAAATTTQTATTQAATATTGQTPATAQTPRKETVPKYCFDETVFFPLSNEKWVKGYQVPKEEGTCITRYFLETESKDNWTKIVNIHYKDRKFVQGNTAEEAMKLENEKSPKAEVKVLHQSPNDILYERTFPSGEDELVRLILTKKGLHRIAYVKKKKIGDEEKKEWVDHLQHAVLGR